MIRKKFFLDKMCVGVDPVEEIVEFDDDYSEEDIKKCFEDWVFDQLDTAIVDVEDDEL